MARSRNPEHTRRSILDSARREFAAFGFAGGRTDAIAAAAGVNKRMLYHYFGSKEQLYAAVLTARLGAYVDAPLADSLADQLAQRAADARERIDDLRLLMWEALTESLPDAAAHTAERTQWSRRVASLDVAQRAGRVGADLDPAQLELAMTALTTFPFAFRRIARLITGHSPGEPAFDDAYAAFLTALAKRLATGPDRPRDAPKPRVRLTAATINRVG